jgi:hypothetical protein
MNNETLSFFKMSSIYDLVALLNSLIPQCQSIWTHVLIDYLKLPYLTQVISFDHKTFTHTCQRYIGVPYWSQFHTGNTRYRWKYIDDDRRCPILADKQGGCSFFRNIQKHDDDHTAVCHKCMKDTIKYADISIKQLLKYWRQYILFDKNYHNTNGSPSYYTYEIPEVPLMCGYGSIGYGFQEIGRHKTHQVPKRIDGSHSSR